MRQKKWRGRIYAKSQTENAEHAYKNSHTNTFDTFENSHPSACDFVAFSGHLSTHCLSRNDDDLCVSVQLT